MTDTVVVEQGNGTVTVVTHDDGIVEVAGGDKLAVTERLKELVEAQIGGKQVVLAHEPDISTLEVRAVGPQGPRGLQGEKGDPGDQGIPGDMAFFTFDQVVPAQVWTIPHNLGGYYAVTVVDSAGTTVEGTVHYDDADTITLTFTAPFSGTAYLS